MRSESTAQGLKLWVNCVQWVSCTQHCVSSCLSQLLVSFAQVFNDLDRGAIGIDTVFLDFKKAFDSVLSYKTVENRHYR